MENKTALVALSVALAVATMVVNARETTERLPVELAVVGDDSMTQAFASSIRSAIENSNDFMLDDSLSAKNIRITIPGNVYWQRSQSRINFHAVTVFTRGGEYIGVSDSSCWIDQRERCAVGVVRDLRQALASKHE